MNDGLHESYSNFTVPTDDGKVWVRHGLGTRVSVLDGFDVRNMEGLDLGEGAVAGKGGVVWAWSRGRNEIVRIHSSGRESFQVPLDPDNGRAVPVRGMLAPLKDVILVLTPKRLYRFSRTTGVYEDLLQAERNPIGEFRSFDRSEQGTLWIGGENGVARLEPDAAAETLRLTRRWKNSELPGGADVKMIGAVARPWE